jgi:hypothetical protein
MKPRDRWAGAAGVVSVVLLLPAAFVTVFAGSQPAPDASTERIVAYLRDHRDVYLASLFFEILSVGLFVWFLAALVAAIAEEQASNSWLANLAFGSGVAYGIMILIEDAAFAAAARLADQPTMGPSVRALWEFGYQEAWPFTRPFVAVLLLSVAAAVARRPRFPRLAPFAVLAAVINLVFLPTLFVRHGPLQAGGVLAHTTATLVLELWILDAALVLAHSRSRDRHR